MISKLVHLWRRWRYQKIVPQLQARQGGSGAMGQDVFVLDLLGGKRAGCFVDIGASDGVTISNTFHLEREHGWSGLAVEPIPAIYEKLKSARSCQTLNACVSDRSGTARFTEVVDGTHMYSGLSEKMDERHVRRIRRTIERCGKGSTREIEVRCLTWGEALKTAGIDKVDFLSLDTEGGELDILRSIDFAATPVRVISVENNYFPHDYARLLESRGFKRMGAFKVDEIYLYQS